MGRRINLIGQSFGRLTAVEYSHTGNTRSYWKCVCECGKECVVMTLNLRSGHTTSCGCYQRESVALRSVRHGKHGSSEYCSWLSMIQRCGNNRNPDYFRYGGRGIVVCERWKSFENFYEDMGPKPTSKHSIERRDNSGPYCKDNCGWATSKEQNNNRRSNSMLTYNGETRTVAQWADVQGIAYATLHRRLRVGWSAEDALTRPVQKRGQR